MLKLFKSCSSDPKDHWVVLDAKGINPAKQHHIRISHQTFNQVETAYQHFMPVELLNRIDACAIVYSLKVEASLVLDPTYHRSKKNLFSNESIKRM